MKEVKGFVPEQSQLDAQVAPSAALRPPYDRAKMPGGVARLQVDGRGYPIPWFVDRAAPLYNGNPDFRVMDGKRLKLAIRDKRCWICGEPIRTKESVFVAGPMCGINRTNAEPPNHSGCAEWAAKACPFLAVPKRIRDERELPANATQAGVGIKRNPGVAMLWTSRAYQVWRPSTGRVLFDMGEPVPYGVKWLCEGRAATRAEVMHSVETGLPLLLAQAAKDGATACFQLGQMAERFMAYLPDETERLGANIHGIGPDEPNGLNPDYDGVS